MCVNHHFLEQPFHFKSSSSFLLIQFWSIDLIHFKKVVSNAQNSHFYGAWERWLVGNLAPNIYIFFWRGWFLDSNPWPFTFGRRHLPSPKAQPIDLIHLLDKNPTHVKHIDKYFTHPILKVITISTYSSKPSIAHKAEKYSFVYSFDMQSNLQLSGPTTLGNTE
jgi:hypothetical protein